MVDLSSLKSAHSSQLILRKRYLFYYYTLDLRWYDADLVKL